MSQQSTLDLSALNINSNIAVRNYWKNRLSDFQIVSYFNQHAPAAIRRDSVMETHTIEAVGSLTREFNAIAGSPAAKHIVLMAAIGALANKYTTVTDVMIFTPVYESDSQHIVPFRMHVTDTQTFAGVVTAVKDNLVKDMGYANFPLERMFGKALADLPLSSAIGMLTDELHVQEQFAHLPVGLLFCFNTRNGALKLELKYNSSVYTPDLAGTIADLFFNLLQKCIAERRVSLKEISLLTGEEKDAIFRGLNNGQQEATLLASYHQERMWFIDYFEAGDLYTAGPVYHNIPLIIELKDVIQSAQLEGRMQHLLARYEILRTVIINIEDSIQQHILDKPDFRFRSLAAASDQELDRLTSDEINTAFELDKLLIRGTLINKWDGGQRVIIVLHHAVADRFTIHALTRELFEENTTPFLPYHRFSEWQKEGFRQLEFHLFPFWKRMLSGGRLKALELPTDRARAKIHIYKAGIVDIAVPQQVTTELLACQAATGISARVILMAIFKVLLYRYARHEEIVIGTSVDNRHAGLSGMIGPVANLIVIRSFVPQAGSFTEYLHQLAEIYDSCLAHSEMPFDKLVADLAPEKDMARTALFDVLYQFEERTALPAGISVVETNLGYGKYDLNLLLQLDGDVLQGKLVYNSEYFDADTVSAFARHFYELANSLLTAPEASLSSARLLPVEEEQSLLQSLDYSEVDFPVSETVHSLFEKQAALHGDRPALIFGDRTMSYGELNEASERLAAYLRNAGVQPGVIVGLLVDRGMETVIGMLGILKAGGAYLPVDVTYPESRKSYMVEDSGTPLLLSTKDVTDAASYGVPVYYIEDGITYDGSLDRTTGSGPADLCYIIYTSGTTGNPKGVMVGHSHVVRLLFNEAFQFDFNESDVWTMFHSHCFDFSVWEMYGALLYGGRLVIIPRIVARDPLAYLELLEKEGVTVLNQTPWSFYQLSSGPRKDLRLRYVIFGGEALVPSKLRQFHETYPQVKLINMFGITETTVHVTYKELTTADLDQDVSNIGKPIPTLSLYILDEQMRPVPRGVLGELYVGGAGVAQGYLNKAELTSRRFIDNPYGAGLLYRSGDQGRQLASGDVEYLGRIDSQVKIRGFRIELGEIESHLSGYAGISSSVVHPYEESGEKSLVAYYVTSSELDHGSLRQYLSSKLPEHMVPSYFMRLSSLPLTGNGKIDRRSLPAPVIGEEDSFVPAGDELESRLVAIWSEVLKVEEERISVTRSFFELGGHSLKVTILSNKIQQALSVSVPVKEIFTNQDIRSLATYIRSCLPGSYYPVPVAPLAALYPLSSAQKRLYFLYEMNRESLAYNMLQVTRLYGRVDIPYLTACFHKLIMRHESLRTAIVPVGDSVMQQVANSVDFTISIYESTEDSAMRIIEGFHRPFDLSVSPLIRVGLVKISEEEHLLLMDMHHIITDGLSQIILIREFMQIYAGEALPALRIGYKDYAVWQESESQLAIRADRRSYWLDVFSGELPVLTLPLDYKRPLIPGDKGDVVRFTLSREEVAGLKSLATESQATLFMVMLSLYNILLSRLSNQDDVVVGITVSGRYHADLEPLTGMFVNTVPLRNYPRRNQSFMTYLADVRRRTLEDLEHQSYPFELLVEDLAVQRDTSRNPLFDVMFAYENFDVATLAIPGLQLQPYIHNELLSKFDMTLTVTESSEDLHLDFEYATDLFKRNTIVRFATYYQQIVRAVVDDRNVLLSDIAMLPVEEKYALLQEFNNTGRPYGEATFTEVFSKQVQHHAQAIAVKHQSVELDYQTLDARSNSIAQLLISAGAVPGAVIPLLMDRTIDLLVWIIGVQKMGGVFIALDTRHPADRIAGVLNDCSPYLLVTQEKYASGLGVNVKTILADSISDELPNAENWQPVIRSAEDIAYIVYTSGSTGVPKGVLLDHAGMVNHFYGLRDLLQLTAADRFAQTAECSFDIYLVQMLLALTVGGCTHIVDREVMLDVNRLSDELIAGDITILEVVPSVIRMLANAGPLQLGKLRCVISTGEALTRELALAWYRSFPDIQLINLYGPAETSDDVSYYIVPKDLEEEGSINLPVGYPLPNFHIHILDSSLRLCPVGVSGEICIAGVGVGKGYIKDRSLTASKFVVNPYAADAAYSRMYRTGDIGYRDEQGLIYLSGRVDNMIKIRGARIEAGDIEALLQQFDSISQTLVVCRENREQKYLVAYYAAPAEIESDLLAGYLSGKLPEYMVPAAYVHLTTFPLTLSGKIDKRALPEPVFAEEVYQAPSTKEEILLAEVWTKILGVARVGIVDNFFSLGGDSIKSIQISSRVRAAGYELSVKDIFANQTIRALARRMKVLRTKVKQEVVQGTSVLTPVQKYYLNGAIAAKAHYNQSVMLHFPAGISGDVVRQIFTYLQLHHDALRIVLKEGPAGLQLDTKSPDLPISLTEYASYSEDACTDLQSGIDLFAGPLMKLGLFHLAEGSHLLIVIHHLVIDGVSWRILFEDITTLYEQVLQKQPFSLPGRTASFLSWAGHLQQYMATPGYQKGQSYWKKFENHQCGMIARDIPSGENRGVDVRHTGFSVDEVYTRQLLREVPDSFRTSVEEVLLTAFTAAVSLQYGQSKVRIDLEGHGREDVVGAVDVSRTIGWFTSVYPVLLEQKGSNWGDRLRNVKESLRTIPNKGIDYLLYRSADAERSGISFNYLGQFDTDTSNEYYRISDLGRGYDIDPQQTREYDWDITGMISGEVLHVNISYSSLQYAAETIQGLLGHFEACLLAIINYCLDKTHAALSPSDLTGNNISMEVLDQLQSQYALQDIYPLSPMQEGMLFHTLYDSEADHYFEQICYNLDGKLNVRAVENTLQALTSRYDILRTIFLYEGYDQLLQVVLKERTVDFSFLDMRRACLEEGAAVVVARCQEQDKQRKFVLNRDVLMRLTIVQTAADTYRFIWSMHHILMDGWCMGLLIRDFNELYDAAVKGRRPALEPVQPYAAYIKWLEERDPKVGLAYWDNYLKGYDLPAGLPKKGISSGGNAFVPSSQLLTLQDAQAASLNELSVKYGVSVYTILQCIWGFLLQFYNDKDDVVFGSVVSGRPAEVEGIESMLGLFINTVPVRIYTSGEDSISDVFQRVQRQLLDSEEYHYNTLPDIQSRSELGRQLLDHILIYENYPVSEEVGSNSSDYRISDMHVFEQTNYDLSVVIVPGTPFTIRFDYNSGIYSEQLIGQVMMHLEQLMTVVVNDPSLRVKELSLSTDLGNYNNTAKAFEEELSIIALFDQQAARTPDAIAIEHEGKAISYAALQSLSNGIAAALSTAGIQEGDLVGVLLDREPGFVYSVLGILRLGAAYIPVDTTYPSGRIAGIFTDGQVKAVITGEAYAGQCEGFRVLVLEDLAMDSKAVQPVLAGGDRLAYMIYTSGSTGVPKGVMISHRSLVNYITWAAGLYIKSSPAVFALYTSVSFDLTITSLFTPLVTGGRLLLYSSHDPLLLEEVIKDARLTVLKMTPSHLKLLSEISIPAGHSLETLIVGGEQLESRVAAAVYNQFEGRVSIYNEYGPTEATVGCMYYVYQPSDEYVNVPIGYPAANTQIYLLDRYQRPVPAGAVGELYIGGAGVAQGYYGKASLTAEVFIPNPFMPGTLMYRSKDTGIYDAGCGLLFTGRSDSQLKIRGYRIEPGEIVHHVCQHAGIREAVVLERHQQLVCYYVSEEACEITLGDVLPAYMIPSHYVHLVSLPLTSNGKLDTGALPDPVGGMDEYESPSAGTAQQLADIWADILKIEVSSISAKANFFTLGGHSLNALTLRNRIYHAFNVHMSLKELFEYNTIEHAAEYIDNELWVKQQQKQKNLSDEEYLID
ncbi:non-ribosomal peptide synthetase [Chitinophaga rhizophila]|uniref:Amino acid adenylation domain-containing protein n=1 Tax=Chitinophaga rhizophila TaxID=2866212 RepID=A0ABS7GHP3_9BACT|nr:non-ribosomal peptide synthetase [Chitinophaga rhizophila]MBW8687219.1 amino acid adenylation domain-containing protein [Chitinophaga rhizophila]